MERTKTVDRFGNVSYELHEDGRLVGRILKMSGYYRAELPQGGWKRVPSIKQGEEVIAFWRRELAR